HGVAGPHRGLGGRAAAGHPVAAGPGGCRRVPGGILGHPPLCARLPDRGGAGPPAGPGTQLPVGSLGAGAAVGRTVRRGHRADRRPGHAGAGRAGESVPGAAGRGAGLVALPPAVRRPAARPPGAGAARAAARAEQHGLVDDAVRHAMAAGDTLWTARLLERHLDELLLRGENATVNRWLTALPAQLTGARPRLRAAPAAP